ncbi:MAG: acyltransferase [Bacteroidota bacterium]|nr:acyltransferase [Bacteroidota bacterium]
MFAIQKNEDLNDSKFSVACRFLRLPLMILVTFIHVKYNLLVLLPYSDFSYSIVFVFTQIISRIAVPSFFVISGYYFFFDVRKQEKFTKQDYKNKLLKRFFSLLIPYLIWNLFYCLVKCFFLHQNFLSLLPHIFDYPMPVAFQFWYIRDLMIMCLISPLLYKVIKKLGLIFIIFLFLIWLLNFNIVLDSSLLFFSLGAYFSIKQKDIVALMNKFKPYLYILFLCFGILDFVFNVEPTNMFHNASNVYPIHCLFILSGVFAIFTWAVSKSKNISLKKRSNLFSPSFVFLLFALHPLTTLSIFTPLLLKISNNTPLLLAYFLPIILSFFVIYLVYLFMKKFLPSLLSVIVGGRV